MAAPIRRRHDTSGGGGTHTRLKPVPSTAVPPLPITPMRPAAMQGGAGDRYARTAPGRWAAGLMAGVGEVRKQDAGVRSHDMWPSRGGGQGDASASASAPYFLKELESYLDRELGVLATGGAQRDAERSLWRDVSDEPDIAVARIFCTAFKMFAQSSRIYGPLLFSIYQKFSNMIDAHEELLTNHSVVVREAEAVRMSFEERCNALANGYDDEKRELADENAELAAKVEEQTRVVEDLRGKCADVKRIEKMYTDKWYEERERVLVMVNQIREAEEQHQETQIQFDKLKRDTMGVQELMRLYQNTADELTQMREDYKETVPAKQFQIALRTSQEKSDKILQMKITFAGLRKKIDALEKQVGKLNDAVAAAERDNTRLRGEKGSDTPRPAWEDILRDHNIEMDVDTTSSELFAAKVIARLQKECKVMAEQDRDIQALRDQLKALGIDEPSSREAQSQEYFVGLGTGRDVPKYLQWFGQVPNRHLSKRETENFLKEFWMARRKDLSKVERANKKDPTKKTRLENIEEFFFSYLKSKHGTQAKLTDRAYNLLAACRKYQNDADCELFLAIIERHLPEAVYYEQMRLLETIQVKFEELEIPGLTGKRTGKVRKNKALMMMDKIFAVKSDENLTKLKTILSASSPSEDVHIPQLFAEDKEGNQTPFVECVRDQMVREYLEYYQQISNAIFLKSSDKWAGDEGGEVCVTLQAVSDAILEVDPNKGGKEVERMISMGLGLPEGSMFELTLVTSLQPFLEKLMRGHLQRHTKPADKESKAAA